MCIRDRIYTKPGGLTSTEALVKNIPIVHTAPIPGCEMCIRDRNVGVGSVIPRSVPASFAVNPERK